MTRSEDVAYGDAEPTEFQQGYIAGIEAGHFAGSLTIRLEALKGAILAHQGDAPGIERSERIIKAAVMFERYLETGK